jgi:alpha-tubulin suppressor-like RCC1 family protein
MATNFLSYGQDVEQLYISDYALIDKYVNTGLLWLWGTGTNGQLGNGDTVTNYSSPVQTSSGGINWTSMSVGSINSAGIKNDGTLWVWGNNSYGQIGNNSPATTSVPTQTSSGGTNWKTLSCGQWFMSAIKTDGTLWTWGQNASGQLGNNSVTTSSAPAQTVSVGNNWKQTASGQSHMLALKTDGTLWAWGANNNGQLGDGTTIGRSSPVQTISGTTRWKKLFDGYCATSRSAAIKTDGTLWMWGDNVNNTLGELGLNTKYSSPIQTAVGGNNWKSVSTSLGGITCAVKTDGTLWAWGYGTTGGLGNGSTASVSSPVIAGGGGTNWKQCAAIGNLASSGMLAIKTDGTLWSWGSNSAGAAGRTVRTSLSSPAQTDALGNNWKSVTNGSITSGALYFTDNNSQYPSL